MGKFLTAKYAEYAKKDGEVLNHKERKEKTEGTETGEFSSANSADYRQLFSRQIPRPGVIQDRSDASEERRIICLPTS